MTGRAVPGLIPRRRQVRVVPCDRDKGCFRWVVSSADGLRQERSAYAFATAMGARLVGEVRAREVDARI